MQRIAVIGGTGMTGQCVVDYALKKGLKVNLLYRTEETLPERFKGQVDLVKGNANNVDDCKNVIKGVDGVCVVLGTRNKLEATTELSTGTKNVVQAMKELDVRPLSVVMSSFLFRKVEEVPAMFHNLNEEHARMLEITKSSDLQYVAILPPHIADEPASEYVLKENEAPGRAVSKHDLAKFIVDSLDDQKYYRKVWGIAKKLQ